MKYKLYSDSSVWHIEYPANMSNKEIAEDQGISNRFRLVESGSHYGTIVNVYRSDITGYKFTIEYVND